MSRRDVSVSAATYARIKAASEDLGVPMTAIIDGMVARYAVTQSEVEALECTKCKRATVHHRRAPARWQCGVCGRTKLTEQGATP